MKTIVLWFLLAAPPQSVAVAQQTSPVITVDSVILAPVRTVEIPARENGVLSIVNIKEGSLVADGDVIATIDDDDAVLEQKEAETALAIATIEADSSIGVKLATASHVFAESELKRALQAVRQSQRSVSESEVDQLRLTAEKAKLAVQQAEEEARTAKLKATSAANRLDRAKQNVARHQITSPIAGIVAERHVERGEWVETGQVVSRLLQIDRLKVEGVLDAKLLVTGLTGAAVTVIAKLPGHREPTRFKGRLVYVSAETNSFNNTVRFRAEIDNSELRLRPGMKTSIQIHPKSKQAVGVKRRRSL